jgi:gamma-glutamylcyclotransferase (GGCT)/AIG2-like uncharacterized protein YtfP
MRTAFIFVYGTLRKAINHSHHEVLARHSDYIAEGYFQGKLYEVNAYPAVIESDNPQDKVYGELYKMQNSDLVLSALDVYEECTEQFPKLHEYYRKKLPITLLKGNNISAWVYIFNHDTVNLTRIY